MYIRNNNGQNINPWETAQLFSLNCELKPLIVTNRALFKEENHLFALLLTPW